MELTWVIARAMLEFLKSVLPEFAQPTVRALMRRYQMADDPVLVADRADPKIYPKVSQKPGVDWPHFVVRNIGMKRARQTRSAENAWVRVKVNGKSYELWWRADDGPKERRTISRNSPEFIPLVRRTTNSADSTQGQCVVTDVHALRHAPPWAILPDGQYDVVLTVQYEPSQMHTTHFKLNVPPFSSGLWVNLFKK